MRGANSVENNATSASISAQSHNAQSVKVDQIIDFSSYSKDSIDNNLQDNPV